MGLFTSYLYISKIRRFKQMLLQRDNKMITMQSTTTKMSFCNWHEFLKLIWVSAATSRLLLQFVSHRTSSFGLDWQVPAIWLPLALNGLPKMIRWLRTLGGADWHHWGGWWLFLDQRGWVMSHVDALKLVGCRSTDHKGVHWWWAFLFPHLGHLVCFLVILVEEATNRPL